MKNHCSFEFLDRQSGLYQHPGVDYHLQGIHINEKKYWGLWDVMGIHGSGCTQANCLEDDGYFGTSFEDILSIVIPHWIINSYGSTEETDVILQTELIGISTVEELQFRKIHTSN